MRLTTEQVRAVASLARLGLDDEELERMRDQLSSILESIALIEELDTASISPTAQTIDLTNVLRDDVAQASLPRVDVLRNAPRQRDGFFEVDSVFGSDALES